MSSTDHLSELESLRSQVADLTRELAERDRQAQDLREQSKLLRSIVNGTAAETGEEFFTALVTQLTSALQIQYAVIGEVLGDYTKKIRTLAVSAGDTIVDNFEYELTHTPCATAMAQSYACFDRGVRTAFPEFQRLADLGAESYCAVSIRGKDGAVVGLLVVMDTKPLENSDYVKSLLAVFVPRVSAEFDRRRAEQERAQSLADLHNVVESIPDIVFALDAQGNLIKWNRRVEKVAGYSSEELLGLPALAFVPPEEHILCATAIERAFTEGYAEFEGHLLTKDHRLIPYHWTGARLKNVQGETIGITGIGRDVSDKKRVEEDLRQQRRHLVEAQALAHLGSWEWELDSGEMQWSDEQYRIFGYKPGSISVMHEMLLAALLPEDHDHVLAAINDALLGKSPYDIECRIVRPNGDVRKIHCRGEVQRDAIGHPLSMAGTVLDITERKQTEESLRASEERWQLAVQGSNDGIWDWNIQTGDIFFSSRWKAMRGFEDHEISSHVDEWRSRIHLDDLDRVLKSIDAYLAKRTSEFCEEYRVQKKDGSYMWILDRGVALWADDGTPLRMAGSETDITERQRTKESLRKSEERFALAVAGSNDILWDAHRLPGEPWHAPQTPVWWSPKVRELLGLEESDSFETFEQWIDRLHPADKDRVFGQLAAHIEQRVPYDVEYRLRTNAGDYLWIRGRGQALWDEHGEPLRMSGSCQDITDRKQAEEALIFSEQQLRTVLDALPVGVWFTDQLGRPVLSNPAARQIWSGIKQVGIETPDGNSGWWETFVPGNEPHRWALSHALTTGSIFLNETLNLECLDGTKKIIRNSTVPIHGGAGEIQGAIVLNEDITLLRQAQAALQLTQFSVDHAVEGFFWIGPDARIFHVNHAACRMLEYTWEELTTMTLFDIDPNFSPESWQAHWEKLKQKGSFTFETKHWSRTGQVVDNEITFNYLQYEGKEYNCAIMRDMGERKRVEEALRASEERYRSLYDETPTMYFTLATDGRVLSVNRFGAEQLGYQVEELIGHSVLGLFYEDDQKIVAASLCECLATPEITRHWEFRKLRKDGSMMWVRETARVGQSSTEGTSVLVTCEDITERKRAEEALQRSEAQFRAMSDASPLGIFLTDADGDCLYTNLRYRKISGLTDEQARGQGWSRAIHPDDRARVFSEWYEAAKAQRAFQSEHRFQRPNGETLWTSVMASGVWSGGELTGYVGTVTDITDRKRVEQELQKSHAFLHQIINTDPNFIFAKDREGRFTLVNQAVADAYGTTVEDLIGMTDADFNPNREEVEFFRQKDLTVMDTLQELFLAEEVITDSGGRARWLQTVKRPILDDEGRAIMVLGASTDITERKRIEETLRQRERDLQAALQERERISQDLHDGILQSLFAVGLALESAKSMMTASALKKEGQPLDQAINQLNYVMREIRNFIAGLGSDLLQGKDLTLVLKQMLASLTENQATNVRLTVEDRAAKALSAEQSLHLIRVIQEAVSNCIQHGHASEARVSLKILKRAIRLNIRDNGRGFSQTDAKKTGHGLRNMASRAQKIGGKFSVLSKVNEGTSIVLDLPREAVDARR